MRISETKSNVECQIESVGIISRVLGINPMFLIPDSVCGAQDRGKLGKALKQEALKKFPTNE